MREAIRTRTARVELGLEPDRFYDLVRMGNRRGSIAELAAAGKVNYPDRTALLPFASGQKFDKSQGVTGTESGIINLKYSTSTLIERYDK